MSWLRIDDTFVDHPKVISLGDIKHRWAFLELLSYCAKHRTDGYFPTEISEDFRRISPSFIARCVAVGLVDKSEDGELRVHDWNAYNPGKDPTGAVRQQRWRNAQRNGTVTENVTGVVTPSRARLPSPTPTPDQEQGQERVYESPSTYAVAREEEHDVGKSQITYEDQHLPRATAYPELGNPFANGDLFKPGVLADKEPR